MTRISRTIRTAAHILATVLAAIAGTAGTGSAQAAGGLDLAGIGYDRGNPDAPIAIVEFGDFACSACGQFARETLPAVHREYILSGLVQWKYIPFVLGSFPNGEPAAKAAECAGEQDAFWSMHDELYARQKEWTKTWKPTSFFEQLARELKLDVAKFSACYEESRAVASRITRNNGVADALYVRATPTFFINGHRVRGAIPIEQFRAIVAQLTGQRSGRGRNPKPR